jgi:Flp pilus assembly protein TadG
MSKILGFLRNTSGVSAIEFAFVFPLMALLYLGGTALTQGAVIKNKVVLATSTIGNLVASASAIDDADMNNILAATAVLIQPYPASPLGVVVSSIDIDANGNATVAWSDASGSLTALKPGDPVALPVGIGSLNRTVIWAHAVYIYTLPVGQALIGRDAFTFTPNSYLVPRRVSHIARCAEYSAPLTTPPSCPGAPQ